MEGQPGDSRGRSEEGKRMSQYEFSPREAGAPVPKGASASSWGRRYFCYKCGLHTKWFQNIHPCMKCGGRGASSAYDEFSARKVRFSLLYRFFCLINRRPQPDDYWEFK